MTLPTEIQLIILGMIGDIGTLHSIMLTCKQYFNWRYEYMYKVLSKLPGVLVNESLRPVISDLIMSGLMNTRECTEAIDYWSGVGDVDIIDCAISKGGDPIHDDNYPIKWATANGHLHVVERFLECEGLGASERYTCALIMAAERGLLDLVEKSLQYEGVDASQDSDYAIRIAAYNGHLEVVKRLLQREGMGYTAAYNNYFIHMAIENENRR